MPLRAVTFDCWKTLLVERDWTRAHARRVEILGLAVRDAGSDASLAQVGTAFDAAWSEHMRCWTEGVVTGASEIADHSLAALGVTPPSEVRRDLILAWEEASHSENVEAVPGARQLLAFLVSSGVRLALISDTGLTPGRVVRRHLERVGLLELLHHCVFSDEIGITKPDPRAFQAALDALEVEASCAAHVGDLLRTDVLGARGAGMRSIRLRAEYDDASGFPEADWVVDSHAALMRSFAEELALGAA